MNYHYVYRITNMIENKHYYGVRTSKNPNLDLGIKYFSSSKDKDFIQDQKENTQNYKYKIIKIFDNRNEALNLEIKLHNKFDVGVNESFYNRAKQTSALFDTSGIKYSYEDKKKLYEYRFKDKRPLSEESRRKISESRKGMKFTEQHKSNIKKSRMNQTVSNNAIMKIYDAHDVLQFTVSLEKNFADFCEENDLPMNSLRKSYQSNGEYRFGFNRGMNKKYYDKYKKYEGWYCLKN